MTDVNAKHLDGAGLSHVFGKIKGALDNRMNDSVEYLYRAVNETEGAPSGLATIDSIHGNTLRWNQLGYGYGADSPVHGITFTFANGVQSATGTASGTGNSRICNKPVVIGHKYLAKANSLHFGSENTSSVRVVRNYNQVVVFSESSTAYIVDTSTWTSGDVIGIQIVAPDGTVVDLSFIPQIFDLTAMFGAGNEPATVAEFEALYPLPYYPYDPGSLLPVRMEGVETVGFNQWDEQWELGSYNNTNGEKVADTKRIRCKNPISVFPDTDYYLNFGSYSLGSQGLYICFYDANGDFLSFLRKWSASLTTPTGAYYMTWRTEPTYGTTYNNDICINISDPACNGTYEPYWSSQRTIPATELRSAGSVYDELRKGKRITRVGAVDLGTLTWSKNSESQFFANISEESQSFTTNHICIPYEASAHGAYDGNVDKSITITNTTISRVWIRDSSYTDATALKTAMSGVILYYALATPTTTPIDPPLALRYKVDSDGTERIMVDERKDAPQSAPVPMDVTYGISLYDSAVDDGMSVAHVRDVVGEPNSPYTEVEWVESDGTQYVYLDWKPPVATWGFEADFISKNATGTSVAAWRSDTNVNGYASVFGTRNASHVNDAQLASYSAGRLLTGGQTATSIGWSRNNRVVMKLHGTTFTKPDGTTLTVSRGSETANKPYANMTVFCCHEGLRRSGTGNLIEGSTTRIYSLKFYDGTTLKVDLVGAIRNRDGMTGLYDKVKGHFYPAQGMTYGDAVGTLGVPDTVEYGLLKRDIIAYVDNRTNTRMLDATVPELTSLEDGQQLTVIYSASITASTQTTELAGWDDTSSNANLYLKVTLADGSKTEWIPCYYTNGSRLTSHYGAGTPILMTYRENVFYNATTTAAGTAVMRGWWADPNYNTDDVYTRYSDTLLAGLNGVKRYSLNMRDANGNWTSIMNEDNNTGATGKTAYTGGLMLGNILYHSSGSVIAAGGNTGQMKESHGGVDFRYDVNGITSASGTTELQLRKPVYLVGTVHSDGLFYLDQTKWWTQTSFAEGKVYVHVGTAYSSYYAIFLSVNNPAYIYDGTKLIEFSPIEIGGRNLFKLSDTLPTSVWVFTGGSAVNGVVSLTRPSSGDCRFYQMPANGYWAWEPNTPYVASVEARITTAGGKLNINPIGAGNTGKGIDITTEWKRYEYAFVSTANVTTGSMSFYNMGSAGSVIELRYPKLERGNKATDWTPAPEDFDSRITAAESKLSGIAAGAEVNQNAFSNVKVGSTTVAADAKTDTLELAGSNVTLTPDATNDKVTIGITASNVTTALGTLPVANGGTGQTSLSAARNAMGLGNTTGALPVANGGTGATSAANARTNLGVPPTSHASSGTTYGTGTDANYGHVKLSGATNSTSGTSGGIAATPSAVKTAYDLANTANGTANTALSGVNGTLIYDHTYTIANGVATFTAHVYCKGEEVTSNYQDSAFSWSYRLSDAISETGTPSVVSLGTGKTKTINITTLGLGGHVIGTFTTD